MAVFRSIIGQLFERCAHSVRRRETPQRAQRCAAKELAAIEKLQERCEDFNFTATDRKCSKRCRKVPEKYQLEEKKEERELKIDKAGSDKDQADLDTVTLIFEKTKKSGRVHQKEREKLTGGSELKEAGEKKRKERKRKERMITEPTPLLVVVKPLQTPVRFSLKPIEKEPMLPSVSGRLILPAAQFKPLPPVTKPQKPSPAPEEVLPLPCSSLQEDPLKLMAVPPSPTPPPDEAVALQQPPSRKPQPFTSFPFKPPPDLILVDLEDEENEYILYTEKTIQNQVKPRNTVACWLAKDSEVQEDAWANKVVEVQGFEEEEGDHSYMGESKAIQGHSDHASQIDEHMRKLFCVASPDNKNETQKNVDVLKKCKRKVPLIQFTWAVEKAKKREEKKMVKEKEQKERELLLQRYMNDPKLKHLWINKYNYNFNNADYPPSSPL